MDRAMSRPRNDAGFSLIESLVAIAILSGGMLAIAAAFLQGTVQLTGSDLDVLAREKAAEAIENVFTARDTRTIQWAQIRNIEGPDGNAGGVFRDGPQPLTRAGTDGLVNTADDGQALETLVRPGPDGLLGTADDVTQALMQFTREVVIRDVSQSLRELRVIVRYRVGGVIREYTIATLISSYA
jgi:prepilin-type N-terminal cleavage/methylation domain-containing protein